MARWQLDYKGNTWTEDDLTGADLAAIQLLIGGGFEMIQPTAGPMQLMAMVTALYTRLGGGDTLETMAALREMPALELLSIVSERPD